MFWCCSLETSHPHPLPQNPKFCSIHRCFFFCFAYRVIVNIFLNWELSFDSSIHGPLFFSPFRKQVVTFLFPKLASTLRWPFSLTPFPLPRDTPRLSTGDRLRKFRIAHPSPQAVGLLSPGFTPPHKSQSSWICSLSPLPYWLLWSPTTSFSISLPSCSKLPLGPPSLLLPLASSEIWSSFQ